MKKLLLILISAALVVACLAPVAAFAANTTSTVERDSVHFIAPTAVTVVGDYLFVADNIEDNRTAIITFDATSDSPEPLSTYELDMSVNGLSNNGADVIYAYNTKNIAQLQVKQQDLAKIGETLNMPEDAPDIVDVACGLITNTTNKTIYVLTASSMYQYSQQNAFIPLMGFSLKDSVGCLSFVANDMCPFYYIHTNGTTTVDRIYLKDGRADNDFTKKLRLYGFSPIGLFELDGKVAMYNDLVINTLDESVSFAGPMSTLELDALYGADCRILDVDAHGERIFVLNSNNKIDVFDKAVENGYDTVNYATIGSDMVSKSVPTQYTSFTLARPNGYPANIVYKTNDEKTSIENIYTDVADYKEYVILGYDGAESSHYYYVMIGDKFGWVKKSDKWTAVNTQVSETLDTEAKFVSLNGVYVYELPRDSAKQTLLTQTATTMKTVKLLQKFTEDGQLWYYVQYDEGKTGFVKSDAVGKFSTRPKAEDITIMGDRKINSSLFAAVNLYNTADLNEGDEKTDDDGNEIKLYSGKIVKLQYVEGDKAFVAVYDGQGNSYEGWIEAQRLIEVRQITTNAIVGLSLLAFAVALATVLALIYFKRKKKIKANRD